MDSSAAIGRDEHAGVLAMKPRRRLLGAATLVATITLAAGISHTRAEDACGELRTLPSHDGTQTRYALAQATPAGNGVALILLAGGGGVVDLDGAACARKLRGNSVVRGIPRLRQLGYTAALVDAPSDLRGEDGLGGFRKHPDHAADIGRLVSLLREQGAKSVWVVGASRGSISALNAVARLHGSEAPDGAVVTSATMAGESGQRRAWVADTVFDLPLEAIRVPTLIVGHARDLCPRSLPAAMPRLLARMPAARVEAVTISGGPGGEGIANLAACQADTPHDFIGQDDELIDLLNRFITARRGAP